VLRRDNADEDWWLEQLLGPNMSAVSEKVADRVSEWLTNIA